MKQLIIKCDEEEHRKFKMYCAMKSTNMNNFINECIKKAIKEIEEKKNDKK